MKKKHRSEFLKAIKERFPEVTNKINEGDGLLTFEVAAIIKFLQTKIDGNDIASTKDGLDLLNYYYSNGNDALHATIRNAVCEDLTFDDSSSITRSWALKYLPEPLTKERDDWFEFMGYRK